MTRFPTTTLAALAIVALPFAAVAETAIDQVSEAVIVASVEDASTMPDPTIERAPAERAPKVERSETLVPRGSSQSEAGYRFTNPYAVPQQTLPLTFPALATFSF
jgi:hypothetical protein